LDVIGDTHTPLLLDHMPPEIEKLTKMIQETS
jgi:hypothetical protein